MSAKRFLCLLILVLAASGFTAASEISLAASRPVQEYLGPRSGSFFTLMRVEQSSVDWIASLNPRFRQNELVSARESWRIIRITSSDHVILRGDFSGAPPTEASADGLQGTTSVALVPGGSETGQDSDAPGIDVRRGFGGGSRDITPAPEPASIVLLGTGLLGLWSQRRRLSR